MDKIHINLGKDSYDILIDTGLVRKAGPAIRDLTGAEKAAIITEDGIDRLYGMSLVKSLEEAGVRTQMIVVPSSEKSRTLQVVRRVYGALVDFGLGSSDTLIALGGRVVGDITGFTAATYHRGISYVQFPTSVLSQIGSSIGGKVTLDLDIPAGKNVVGTFYQPKAVFVDPGMAKTLPRRYFHNGLGEAVKLGCVADKALFELLNRCRRTWIFTGCFRKSSAAAAPSRLIMWKSILSPKESGASSISATPSAVPSNGAFGIMMRKSPTARPQPSVCTSLPAARSWRASPNGAPRPGWSMC